MRECWNRQTGTFEVRVSLTCGFKSHLSHQTPFRFWTVFFLCLQGKSGSDIRAAFSFVWCRRTASMRRLTEVCRLCPRGFLSNKNEMQRTVSHRYSGLICLWVWKQAVFSYLPPRNRLFRCCLKGAIQGLRTVFPKARWQGLCRGSPDLSPILRLPCRSASCFWVIFRSVRSFLIILSTN